MTALRFGQVTEIDAGAGRARVVFEESEGLLSPWLPVGHHKTRGDRVLWMPDVGAHVACLLDEYGEAGIVLTQIYSEAEPPPAVGADRLHVELRDGAVLQYDRAVHHLTVNMPAGDSSLRITVNGDVLIEVPGDKHVRVGGDAGQQLATRKFVEQYYNTHTHLSAAPGSPTSPPLVQSPRVGGTDLTKKQLSE